MTPKRPPLKAPLLKYQSLLDALERVRAIEGIKKGLASMKSGKGRDAAEFFAELRKKMGIPPK